MCEWGGEGVLAIRGAVVEASLRTPRTRRGDAAILFRPAYDVASEQAPVLMSVARDRTIGARRPQRFFAVDISFGDDTAHLRAPAGLARVGERPEWLTSFALAEHLAAVIDDAPLVPWRTSEVIEEATEAPPRLFARTPLERHCAGRFGWNARYTLDLALDLHRAGHLTDPRSESESLPSGYLARADAAAVALEAWVGDRCSIVRPSASAQRKHFDAGRATAGHIAIVPTAEVPSRLDGDAAALWTVVAARFVTAFQGSATVRVTRRRYAATIASWHFDARARGRRFTGLGWRRVASSLDARPAGGEILLGALARQSFAASARVIEGRTQPPADGSAPSVDGRAVRRRR